MTSLALAIRAARKVYRPDVRNPDTWIEDRSNGFVRFQPDTERSHAVAGVERDPVSRQQ